MRLRIIFMILCLPSLILISFVARYNKSIFAEEHQSPSSWNKSAVQLLLSNTSYTSGITGELSNSSQTSEAVQEEHQSPSSWNKSAVQLLLSNTSYTSGITGELSNSSQTSEAVQGFEDDEWKNIYESNVDLTKMSITPVACQDSRDTNTLLWKDVSSDLSDWTFSKKRDCPRVNFDTVYLPRNQTVFQCGDDYINVSSSLTNKTNDVFQVPFGSKCLADVIVSCCSGEKLPVPNVVHYVWCKRQKLGFFQFLSFISVLRFIKPCMILFHGDSLPYGNYWDYFASVYPHVIHVDRTCPLGGEGHRLGFFEHASDVMRIEALIFYGGIYLDWDEIMLRPVVELRQFKYTQGYEESYLLGSQFLMAERNATFLQHWYRGYIDDYQRDSWAYNALMLPAELVKKFPHLIHTEGYSFTSPSWNSRHLIYIHNYNWTSNYAMHLFIRDYPNITDETIIRNLNTTIGAVSRHVIFGNKDMCK